MAKTKVEEVVVENVNSVNDSVAPITVEFSNGDLNTLRVKLNEVIARINK